MHESTTLPTHPRTGLRAVGIVKGRPVWPILGGSEPPEPPAPPAPPQYTPPASQADLDRIVEQRLARERQKYADYDTIKQRAEAYDALELDLSSETEKAVKAAQDEARKAALAEANPRAVRAEFKAEAKGVLTKEQLDALLDDLDLSKYLTAGGDVDEEKIAKKIQAFAPTGNGKPPRPLGQGTRPPSESKPGDAGRAMAEKRFGSKKS
jgi:hypothetical protein